LKALKFYQLGRPIERKVTDDDLRQTLRMGFINQGKKSGAFSLEIAYILFE
jgi:hypothetical protein